MFKFILFDILMSYILYDTYYVVYYDIITYSIQIQDKHVLIELRIII